MRTCSLRLPCVPALVLIQIVFSLSNADAPRRYVELYKTAFEVIKDADLGIPIVGLNSTSTEKSQPGPDGVVNGATWSAEVLKAGGLKWSNAASFHTYHDDANGFPRDTASRAVNTAVGPNNQFRRIQRPVWMSEGSSTVGGRLQFCLYKHLLHDCTPQDLPELAESVLRYDLSLLANGVKKNFPLLDGRCRAGHLRHLSQRGDDGRVGPPGRPGRATLQGMWTAFLRWP